MNQSMEKEFSEGKLFRLILRLSIPMVVAQLINVLYNIVDRIYIGHIEGVGASAIAGVGLTFPIIITISAFASLVGMGGAPIASIRMGQGRKEQSEEILGNAVVMMVILGITLPILFFLFKDKLLYLFGASAQTFPYANSYISIYAFGSIFVMFSLGLNSFINSQGFTKIGMLTVLLGAVTNIVLDPIFIFVFGMGVQGAALATVLSQCISAVWALCFLCGKKAVWRVQRKNLRLRWDIIKQTCALGLSPFIMQITEGLLQIAFNVNLQMYGGAMGDTYIAIMTVLSSVLQLCNMPLQGFAQGTQPIIGFNYGAKNYARIRKAVLYMFILCLSFSFIMWIVVMSIPDVFIRLFNNDPHLLELGEQSMRLFFSMSFIMGLQMSSQQTFLAMGQAKISIFFALLRKIILLIPMIFVLPQFIGVNGVFLSEPIADTISAVSCFICFLFFLHRHLRDDPKPDRQKVQS